MAKKSIKRDYQSSTCYLCQLCLICNKELAFNTCEYNTKNKQNYKKKFIAEFIIQIIQKQSHFSDLFVFKMS